MSEAPVKWRGSFADESGWHHDLYAYLKSVRPEEVAIGRFPPAAQRELAEATKAADRRNTLMALATVLIACQQAYGERFQGTVGADAISELYAAYTVDSSMTSAGPVDDSGTPLVVSFAPNKNERFMMAHVLKLYVEQGFPEQIDMPRDRDDHGPVRFDEHIAVLRDLDLVGSYAKSSNGRFALVWSDEVKETGGGERAESRWAVLVGKEVLSQGRVPGRINTGAISDIGRFMVDVTRSSEKELHSDLVGLELRGNVYFSATFEALPCAIAISSSGRLGAVHLAASTKDQDSNMLILFDLGSKQELWRRHLTVYPRQLVIREDAGLVESVPAGGPPCSFHVDGRSALDDPGYAASLSAKGDAQVLAAMAWARLEDTGTVTADGQALAVLAAAVSKSDDPYFKARTLRDLGSVCYEGGLLEKAVEYWREALAISPQIGVKKRLAGLERQLGVKTSIQAKPQGTAEGRLKILHWYDKIRAEQVACLASTTVVATASKGQTMISEVGADGSLRTAAQVPGSTPRLYSTSTGVLVLTDEGRIGEGQAWASLITPSAGVVAQVHFRDKLTEAAMSGDLVAVGCRDGHLYGLAVGDLKERWRFKVPGQGDGYSVPHPYHVAAGGDLAWVSYMSAFWSVDRTSGKLVSHSDLDMPTEVAGLPDGTLAATIYKGLVLVKPNGAVRLTEINEPNARIYGVDAGRGWIIAGRWGQGEAWHKFDFSGRILREANLGPCDHAELSKDGYLAIQRGDAVTVVNEDLQKVGILRQPEVTGNRVRAIAWGSGGILWVIGKGLWKLQVPS